MIIEYSNDFDDDDDDDGGGSSDESGNSDDDTDGVSPSVFRCTSTPMETCPIGTCVET